MAKDSCIPHGDGYYIELRRDYIDLFDGDQCAATVLAYFEWMTNNEMAVIRNRGGSEEPWIKASMPFIHTETLGLFSIRSLQTRIDMLESHGILQTQKQMYSVTRYLLDHKKVVGLLKNRNVIRVHSIGKIADQQPDNIFADQAADCVADQAADQYKEDLKSIIPNQIIDPDPVSESYSLRLRSDTEEVYEVADGSARSDNPDTSVDSDFIKAGAWGQADWKSFRIQFKGVGGRKPNAEDFRRAEAYISKGVSPEAASAAVEGYKKYVRDSGEQPSMREFLGQFYKWKSLSAATENAAPIFEKVSPTTSQATPHSQNVSNGPQWALQQWETIVGPLPKPWHPPQDDKSGRLSSLCRDPGFTEALPDICVKCKKIIDVSQPKWLTFRWLLGEKNGTNNWWKIACGEMDWMATSNNKKLTASEEYILSLEAMTD